MFKVVSLASGSSGNALLITAGKTPLLVDAGIPVPDIVSSLHRLRVEPRSLYGILLTHEHADHSSGAIDFCREFDIPLIANARTLKASLGRHRDIKSEEFPSNSVKTIADLRIESFPVPHDAVQPVGYSFYYQGHKVSLALDLGYVTSIVKRQFEDANLIIIECNHDVELLERGPYPTYLKARIKSKKGHLSNEQAFRVIYDHPNRKNAMFWLAHLSETNNSPELVAITMNVNLKLNGITDARYKILPRHRISEVWSSSVGEQNMLF